jgi:hypothetical protein
MSKCYAFTECKDCRAHASPLHYQPNVGAKYLRECLYSYARFTFANATPLFADSPKNLSAKQGGVAVKSTGISPSTELPRFPAILCLNCG